MEEISTQRLGTDSRGAFSAFFRFSLTETLKLKNIKTTPKKRRKREK